MTERVVT